MAAATQLTPSMLLASDDSGATTFRLSMLVTALKEGDLPSINVFVNKIVDVGDPKADVFARVASIADLTTLKIGRTLAVTAGASYYLLPEAVTLSPDAITASSTRSLIEARVTALILQWRSYVASFLNASPITVPTVSSDLITAAQKAYEAAKANTAAKATTVAATSVTYVAAKKASDVAAAALAAAIDRSSYCVTTKNVLTRGISDETTFVNAGVTFMAAVRAVLVALDPVVDPVTEAQVIVLTTAADAFASAQATEATAMGELNQARTRVETGCTNAQTDLDSATNAKVQADQALGQATAAKATAEAALVQAQTAQNLAQAAVLAVCPDYAV
jgi:hypothetical protein